MDLMEIFTLVTGVIYVILEIRQKNFMWVVGIATSLAAMWGFFSQSGPVCILRFEYLLSGDLLHRPLALEA